MDKELRKLLRSAFEAGITYGGGDVNCVYIGMSTFSDWLESLKTSPLEGGEKEQCKHEHAYSDAFRGVVFRFCCKCDEEL